MAGKQPAKEGSPARSVTPVFGPMVHPYLGVEIAGATVFEAIDGWLQSQIDAGKLRLCS